jgi:ketosteroid isomerase-like protein
MQWSTTRKEPHPGELARQAFNDWMNGTGYVADLFSPELTWEIVGHSAASAKYSTAQEFQDKVLTPFAQRFKPEEQFRPVKMRGFYVDGDTVIAFWDGAGTTIVGSVYENTYVWIMTFRDGQIVDSTAFYDSISFEEGLIDGLVRHLHLRVVGVGLSQPR